MSIHSAAPKSRFNRVLAGAVTIALLSCTLPAADKAVSSATSARPNIVLIVTDDQGYGDASSYWNTDLQTPFMDEIGRSGVRFTQFRVHPLCAPTRASIMTGLDSLAAGMWRGPGESARGATPAGGWPANERRIKVRVDGVMRVDGVSLLRVAESVVVQRATG